MKADINLVPSRMFDRSDSRLCAFSLDPGLKEQTIRTLGRIGLSGRGDFSATLRALLAYFNADEEFADDMAKLIEREILATPKGRPSVL